VIALAVRWYARFRLSYADVAEWPAERGFAVDRTAIYRAFDEEGQVVDASFSERRNGAAAQACFERATAETKVTPVRVTTDKATCNLPALHAVLPGVEHRRPTFRNNGLERDHSHLKQRPYPMRGFKRGASADTLARGHAVIRNLRGGLSLLTAAAAPDLRLAVCWPRLMQAI
jgi:transposase, IS6 family